VTCARKGGADHARTTRPRFSIVRPDSGRRHRAGGGALHALRDLGPGDDRDHLAKTIEAGLENQAARFPLWLRVVAPVLGPVIFRRILKKRRFPTGVKAPANLVPNESCDCADAVARLNAAIARAAAFRGPRSRHPIFGRATVEQWQEAMMIHCAHHLSFLVPNEATKNATRAS
jgi:hypothetical protein